MGIKDFAALIGKPLYPYQLEIARAILSSIYHERGDIFTVMMARQSGKNQLSAMLEAFILARYMDGNIIKAAPTFNPQIINSRRRLMMMLEARGLHNRIWTSWGMIGLAPSESRGLVKRHIGPAVQFFSAEPTSNVVGATASLLLEIDEAQDVTPEKYDRDFRPMASTTNATTVLYGTAWADDTLLAMQAASNVEIEERGGRRLNFKHDWRTLAAINPNYKKFVESEIARLGIDHISIKTQYLLEAVSGAGHLFTHLQLDMLKAHGQVYWEDEPDEDGGIYIAGMDVAGEERPNPDGTPNKSRDSTVITIGKVANNGLGLPGVVAVHHEWWTGMPYLAQYEATVALCETWGLRCIAIDATGLGEALVSLLVERLGEDRVKPFRFTRPSKSRLGYQLLSLVNTARLKLYTMGDYPVQIAQECWGQLRKARYRLPAPETIDFYVDQSEGHDDFVISLALLGEALGEFTQPAESAVVRPLQLYVDGSRF